MQLTTSQGETPQISAQRTPDQATARMGSCWAESGGSGEAGVRKVSEGRQAALSQSVANSYARVFRDSTREGCRTPNASWTDKNIFADYVERREPVSPHICAPLEPSDSRSKNEAAVPSSTFQHFRGRKRLSSNPEVESEGPR